MMRGIGLSLICVISLNAQIFIFGDTHSSETIDKVPMHTLEIGNLVFTSSSSDKSDIKSLTNEYSVAAITILPKSRYTMRHTTIIAKPIIKAKTVKHTVGSSKTIHKVPTTPINHPKKTDASKYLVN